MKRTSLFVCAGGLVVAAMAGCQAIAGLETRNADPQATGCSLPSTGNGRVRLANMANVGPGSSDANNVANFTDFCIRTSGSSDWGRPIFRDGGNDQLCLGTATTPGGLTYGQETVPFAVPVGKIDVKAIPSGKTCSEQATSEVDGVAIGDSVNTPSGGKPAPVTTLVRWGGGSTKEAIVALQERQNPIDAKSTEAGDATVRGVNVLSSARSIVMGKTNDAFLPTKLSPVSTAIAVGGVAAPGGNTLPLFPVDGTGYLEIPPQPFTLGAAYSDDTADNAIAEFQVSGTSYGSFFLIGDPGDTQNRHPVRGVYCDEVLNAASAGDAGATNGTAANLPAPDRALLAQCTLSNLSLLSVDIVNVSLYGANAPFQDARALAIPKALAARTSDLMCVVEVDDNSNRQAIITAAAAANFPYSFDITTTTDTPPTNADDVHTLTTPPCGGSVPVTAVSNWLNCVDQNCSTLTGDAGASGILNGTSACLEDSCFNPLVALYTAPITASTSAQKIANDGCFACTVYYLTSETLSSAQDCVNNAQPPFAFDGQTPSLILSHYPLANTKSYILPATGFRRGVLKAQVVLEDQTVDFFCAQLSSAFIDSTVPYTGFYGSDTGPYSNGWEDEQNVQAKEAIAWIQSEIKADGLPALIAGDLHADDASGTEDDGGFTVAPRSPEVYDAFAAAFTPAIPQNYTAACDYCPAPENVYNVGEGPNEIMHAFVSKFPTNATQSETLWGTDNGAVPVTSLPGEPAPAGGTGPLFEYWAHNYQVLRP